MPRKTNTEKTNVIQQDVADEEEIKSINEESLEETPGKTVYKDNNKKTHFNTRKEKVLGQIVNTETSSVGLAIG